MIGNGGIAGLMIDIARGAVDGAMPFSSYGKYVATGAISNQVIWPDGTFAIPPSTGVQMSISSSGVNAAQDSASGTGIRTIDIHYLDDNLVPQVEVIIMNGTTAVLTVATNIRFIQCMHILTAGTARSAVGTINASNGGQIYAQIAAGSRRCSSSARMVPAGKKLFVAGAVGGSISGTAAAGAEIKISSTYFEGHDLTSQLIFIPFGSITIQDNAVPYTFPIPTGPYPSGSIVAMEATVDKASVITGNWFGWLENA